MELIVRVVCLSHVFYAYHDEVMMDLDFCNDCHQTVGTPCSLV
jgi:hypothetical protein